MKYKTNALLIQNYWLLVRMIKLKKATTILTSISQSCNSLITHPEFKNTWKDGSINNVVKVPSLLN